MVHIARGDLDRAESVLREGTIVQDRQANLKQRYPAKGLHWLLGLVRLARGDQQQARDEFDREIACGAGQLYAAEFNMNAYDGAGFAALAAGDAAEATAMFKRALELFPEHARSLVGLGAALTLSSEKDGATAAFEHARHAIESLRRGGRTREATMAEASMQIVQRRPEDAIASLKRLVEKPELPFSGWTIPIEPLFVPLRERPDFREILGTLAQNAR
jgi:tetratricopeptide (TPR) repeat protein